MDDTGLVFLKITGGLLPTLVPLPLIYHFLEHLKDLQGGSFEYFFLFISKVSLKLLSSAGSPGVERHFVV